MFFQDYKKKKKSILTSSQHPKILKLLLDGVKPAEEWNDEKCAGDDDTCKITFVRKLSAYTNGRHRALKLTQMTFRKLIKAFVRKKSLTLLTLITHYKLFNHFFNTLPPLVPTESRLEIL